MPHAEQPGQVEQGGEAEKCPLGTQLRNEQQHWQEGAKQAAQRADGENSAGNLPGQPQILYGEAQCEGRNAAEQGDWPGEQYQYCEESAHNHGGVHVHHGGCGALQDGTRHQRD